MLVRRASLLAALALLVAGFVTPASAIQLRTPTVRIMPLGDSITLGATGVLAQVHWSDRTPGGYREPLNNLLTMSRIGHVFVGTSSLNDTPDMRTSGQGWHEGHGGYRIDQVDTDLDGVAGGRSDDGGHWLTGTSAHAPIYPDVVIIHLGTNDIFRRYDPSYSYPTSNHLVNWHDPAQRSRFVADMTERLRLLVEKIYQLRPDTRIVLSDVVPMGRALCDWVTGEYSNSVRALVQREQARYRAIVYASVWHAFTYTVAGVTMVVPGFISDDGIHPTALGYNRMAQVYRSGVFRVLSARR